MYRRDSCVHKFIAYPESLRECFKLKRKVLRRTIRERQKLPSFFDRPRKELTLFVQI